MPRWLEEMWLKVASENFFHFPMGKFPPVTQVPSSAQLEEMNIPTTGIVPSVLPQWSIYPQLGHLNYRISKSGCGARDGEEGRAEVITPRILTLRKSRGD